MSAPEALGLILASYLLGSVSFAWLLVRALRGTDLRAVGSGNLGATNAGRILGRKWAVAIYLLDFLKGFLPTVTGLHFLDNPLLGALPLALVMGAAAFAGHCWPVWMRFRGGKGVATASGLICARSPLVFLCSLGVFWAAVAAMRRISVGSMLAAIALPIAFLVIEGAAAREGEGLSYLVFFITLGTTVIILHRKNIQRLLQGTEPRIGSPKP